MRQRDLCSQEISAESDKGLKYFPIDPICNNRPFLATSCIYMTLPKVEDIYNIGLWGFCLSDSTQMSFLTT